jgi:hypothetical protein
MCNRDDDDLVGANSIGQAERKPLPWNSPMHTVQRMANLWEFTDEFTDPLDIANKIRAEPRRPLIEVQRCGL